MYLRRGDEVHFHMHILWSSASGFGGTMQVSLPPVSAMSDFPQSVTIGEQSGFPAGVVLTSATVTAAQMLTITNRGQLLMFQQADILLFLEYIGHSRNGQETDHVLH